MTCSCLCTTTAIRFRASRRQRPTARSPTSSRCDDDDDDAAAAADDDDADDGGVLGGGRDAR